MANGRILALVLAAASVATVCGSLKSQAAQALAGQDSAAQGSSGTHYKVRQVPEPAPPEPFPPGSETPGRVAPVEIRSMDQIPEHDRELEADAESSIAEHAAFFGIDFNQGKWGYQELVCPALPNHIFLRFTRDSGAGDVSLFTASIPRGGDGRVRIVPIRLRGYSLFSPAPINALTISAFNHIRAEESPGKAPDWLGTGLCYAALAGGHAQAVDLTPDPESRKFPAAIPAMVKIQVQGGAIVEFTDAAAFPKLMQWTMTFDGKGRLLKATHFPVELLKINPVPPDAAQVKGAPVPRTVQDIDLAGNGVQ
jgi:hypothetical protein